LWDPPRQVLVVCHLARFLGSGEFYLRSSSTKRAVVLLLAAMLMPYYGAAED